MTTLWNKSFIQKDVTETEAGGRTKQNGTKRLNNRRYDASLTQGQDTWADRSAERVGDVISTDADRQHERNDEANDHDPYHVRIHVHHHGHSDQLFPGQINASNDCLYSTVTHYTILLLSRRNNAESLRRHRLILSQRLQIFLALSQCPYQPLSTFSPSP